jgi:protein subunit release factor A
MVSDHRTGMKASNVDAVLDGDLDPYMVAMLLELAGDPTALAKSAAARAEAAEEP